MMNIKKLKKPLFGLSLFLGLAAMIGYALIANSSHIFATWISKTTQTPVTINAIDFHRKAFTIQNLVVGNTKEAYIPTAFRAEVVEVETPYSEFFRQSVVIDSIKMNNVYLDIEFYTEDKMNGNWQALINNMKESDEGSVGKRQATIKKLVLTNVHVTLILSDGKVHRLSPIPRLEFENITAEEGIPFNEISEIIARKMIYSILSEEGLNLIIKIPLKVIKKILPFI
ncbi:MAG: hypothetical protein KDK71_10450 [Chlamydiia bacterium]|nr:hypothetical protein [Chlamydiia bacterium]MCP5505603.1 hypothetical protein [Chlamydiales bacterium]